MYVYECILYMYGMNVYMHMYIFMNMYAYMLLRSTTQYYVVIVLRSTSTTQYYVVLVLALLLLLPVLWGTGGDHTMGVGGVFLLEVQYSILKSLISTCVLSYVGSREDWLLDRICES